MKSPSILDRENFDNDDQWYTNGVRVVWWDRRIRCWTTYLIDSKKHQIGSSDYHPNKKSFLECERRGDFKMHSDIETRRELLDEMPFPIRYDGDKVSDLMK